MLIQYIVRGGEVVRYPVNYIGITQGFHSGKSIDLGWSVNTLGSNQPVYACDSGTIYKIEVQPKGGNVVFILHDNGMVSCYSHLANDSILVRKGEKVVMGQQIALMGSTGSSATGNHLHFGLFANKDVIYKDSTINPFDYLLVYPDQVVGERTLVQYANNLRFYSANLDVRYVFNVGYEGLNVRKGPSLNDEVVDLIPIGTRVNVLDESGSFVQIGENRWVWKAYLVNEEPNYKQVKPLVNPILNVRSGPGTSYPVIATIASGHRVQVFTTKNGWAKISPNAECWVSANYLI